MQNPKDHLQISMQPRRIRLSAFFVQNHRNGWLPDFSTSGAVKKGEVEMNAAIALKASKAAGVFRNIKVK